MYTGSITLRIENRLDDVCLIGLSIRGMCRALTLDADAIDAVELCVVEAVNNAVEHAYGDGLGNVVEVDVSVGPAALRIAVRDCGRAMDWSAACARADAYAADILTDGGRGIFIIRSLMDEVSYDSADGWNVLTMVKHAPAAVATEAALARSNS